MTEEKAPKRFRPVTWTRNHIKKRSDAFKEGVAAAKAGKSIDDCPYTGWISASQVLRINWCSGFSSIKHPKIKKKTDGQVDLEEWLRGNK
jgi:ribosome modulation factor